ncbi:MAG: hypothetical protein GX241_01225 [Ruminococcaceae bacterium]|nr:hypothetical protein [Oscillospiraceae bacterium]
MLNKISQSAAQAFDTNYKIGLLATTDHKGDPHITLLSTLKSKGEDKMMFANFIVGQSNEFMQKDTRCGFLILSADQDFWTGRMDYTNFLDSGEDYEAYNRTSLFRYNSYMGADSVYYFDLKDISEGRALDMFGIVINAIGVSLARLFRKKSNIEEGLSLWALELLQKLDSLCFISWHDKEGYPVLAPCIQLQALDRKTLILSPHPYSELLKSIEPGARVAVYGANLQFEAVLAKGEFSGFKGGFATIDIDRIYNPIPPKHCWIYGDN